MKSRSGPRRSGAVPATILGVRIDATTYAHATRTILDWARAGDSRYVCVANVHMIMEAVDSPQFCRILNEADMLVPDGMPLVWMLRRTGSSAPRRVYGPDLMRSILAAAEMARIPIGLVGSTRRVHELLHHRLNRDYPGLLVAYAESPPMGNIEEMLRSPVAARATASGARILFVALGCPKQEQWMAAQRGRIPAVMIGVGAAFDFLAGTKAQAPSWMRRGGLEWLFRLAHEPRRLARRYFVHNPRFLILGAAEALGIRRRPC